VPVTHEIVDFSLIVNCSIHREYVVKNESGWFNLQGKVNVLQIPHEVIWKNPVETLPFYSAPISETTAPSMFSIQSIKQTVDRIQKLEAVLSALVRSSNEHLFKTNTPHVNVVINGIMEVSALVDTGAVYSLLDYQVAKKLPELSIRESYVRPVAANGEIIPLVGQAFVTITVGDVEEIIQVCIQHSSTTSLLLGTNFLCRFKCIEMNCARSKIKFKNTALPCTGMLYNPLECRGLVSMDVATIIPAKSIMRFPVPLRYPYSTASTVKFEPSASRNQNVYLAASICEVVDAKIPVQILNLNSYPIKLYENCSIGTVRMFLDQNNDVNTIDSDKRQQNMNVKFLGLRNPT